MARALWKGSIAFGLVTIPIELHTAVRDNRPRFRLLHATDRSPIKYERVCQTDGRPVAWDDLVKGYEYEKGRFVVLTKDDFKTAALEKSRTVQILDFVNPNDIDERFFETPYYLTPGGGGERAYALFREALRQNSKVGIAKIILRDAQHLAAVKPIGDALVLTMMRFADQLAETREFKFPSATGIRQKELEMARMLVDSFSAAWDPGKYTDEYRENLMRIIQAKLRGRRPRLEAEEVEPKHAEVVDLMARLRKSLEAAGKRPPRTRPASPAARKRKRKVA